ncbi:Oxysterol-binding protein- protein 1 [Desmophyllum pertusum]|uniref:Oxysterol-binding protein- protein 1 n=1 Tax=Desmophyllum pertusum TaxID=174260 RepID=A0A9X0CJJ7_9CNID|nr:Oxysterol-binding protein- protein 1 [Desmophyllum pertusum]
MSSSSKREENEEKLLQSSRRGDLDTVLSLLQAKSPKSGSRTNVDVNCKGRSKANQGWTPLHLAAYFGHNNIVKTLLENGADVNTRNGMGDTALHRAAFTGRTDVVTLLIQYNADVTVINGEGRKPSQVTNSTEVKHLIKAAERSLQLKLEERLLTAARDGDTSELKKLIDSTHPPNINCQDMVGNTPLHCAAYRGHKVIAVTLLQHGADTTIKNSSGFVSSVFSVQDSLGGKSFGLSWREVFLVISTKELTLQVALRGKATNTWTAVNFLYPKTRSTKSKSSIQTTQFRSGAFQPVKRAHRFNARVLVPTSSSWMKRFLELTIQLADVTSTHPSQSNAKGSLLKISEKLNEVVTTSSQNMCHALTHCLDLLSQQEEVRHLRFEEEVEKRRVLEDALHVLATEHHALECSIGAHEFIHGSRMTLTSDCNEEFFDARSDIGRALPDDLLSDDDSDDGDEYVPSVVTPEPRNEERQQKSPASCY